MNIEIIVLIFLGRDFLTFLYIFIWINFFRTRKSQLEKLLVGKMTGGKLTAEKISIEKIDRLFVMGPYP